MVLILLDDKGVVIDRKGGVVVKVQRGWGSSEAGKGRHVLITSGFVAILSFGRLRFGAARASESEWRLGCWQTGAGFGLGGRPSGLAWPLAASLGV